MNYSHLKILSFAVNANIFLTRIYTNRQHSLVTHLHEIVTNFKKSTLKFNIFEKRKQKAAQRLGSLLSDFQLFCATPTQFYYENIFFAAKCF